MQTRIVGLCCAALLVAGIVSAVADPIVVPSGTISAELGEGISATLNSSAFTLSLIGPAGALQMPAAVGIQRGHTVDLSAVLDGTFLTNPGGQSTVLDLDLIARPVQVTTTAGPSGILVAHLQTPFTMSGRIAGIDVAGAGTLRAIAESASGLTPDVLDVGSADWIFSQPGSSPTPEPPSCVLLTIGVLCLVSRRLPA